MSQSVQNKTSKIKLPKHVAIIMDGNGRWAKKRGLKRTLGHQNAIDSVRASLDVCNELGIEYLTLFAFSTENWNRPKMEVNFLMKLLAKTLRAEIEELNEKGVILKVIGEIESLPSEPQRLLKEAVELTSKNKKLTLTLALNYGAQSEIVRAAKLIAKKVKEGKLEGSEIDTAVLEEHLYTRDIPNVDLLIRTSGEYRISNFLLWQIAYAELYFTDVLWPDFRKPDFMRAIESYASRERRYGKTGEQVETE